MSKGIKLSIILSLIFAVIGVLLGSAESDYTAKSMTVHGFIGAFLGVMFAPELEPKYFHYPVIWQMVFAIIGCMLFAYSIDSSFVGYAIAFVFGGFFGYIANFWLKYINIP